ncbi:unnamed protein product [Hymenolepis diminuta]|uniref:RING-type E3 ubiquitin transferase BRCA1 n=1 Tax=Hymenolepis diminuta TaxID=6216 RepID=A0A564YD37_HYMDI|nr:unnamed protein product [Hymenolepis diminuta]
MTNQEITQCLTLLQQAFRCPICLENMQNPRVSPCSHIFCNLCLERTVSGKSSTTCPLCKKEFLSRAFVPSTKFDQISKAIKEIVDNFAEECQAEFVPATRFEPLHLSQEYSQTVPQQSKGTSKKRSSTARFSVRNARIEQIAKATKRAPAEFFKHIRGKNNNRRSSNSKEESQSLLPNQANDNEHIESDHQRELFAMTQTPLLVEPGTVDLSDFPDLSTNKNSNDSVEGGDQQRSFLRSRRPRLLSTVKKHVFRSLSRDRKRRFGSPDSQNSTVSSCSLIPPLRERLSLVSTPTERIKSSPPKLRGRKRRRLSNELYSPWLRNSRMHFLKKYRIPSQPPMTRSASSELPSTQSPSWSGLKNITGDIARGSKRPPLLFSSKKKNNVNLSTSSADKNLVGTRETRKFPVCRFSLPAIVGRKFKETEGENEEKGGKCASANVTPIRKQVKESPGLMSVVTIQPSCIPQTFSLNSKSCSGRSSPSTISIEPSMVPQTLSLATLVSKTQARGESEELSGDLDLTVALIEATDTHPTPQVPSSTNAPAFLTPETPQGTSNSALVDASPTTVPRVSLVKNNIISLAVKHRTFCLTVREPKESKRMEVDIRENDTNAEIEKGAVQLRRQLETEATMVDAEEMEALLARETMDVEEDDNEVISASPNPSPVQPIAISEPSRLLEGSHSRTVGAEGIDEDVDIIPSSQNEEAEQATTTVVESVDTTIVARVESSQAGAALTTLQALGPLPIRDTMPFTQAAPRALQTSVIADTENMFGRNDEEPPQPTIYITGSNLTAEQANAVHRFCTKFNAKETPTFDPAHTTHVVITTSDKNPRIATRTLKYFMAVLYGTWLINPLWIRDCLRENKILPEEPYEIRGDYQCETLHEGPRKGRLRVSSFSTINPTTMSLSSNMIKMQGSSSHVRDSRPFVDIVICPFKNISPLSMNDFEAIVVAGGGIFVKDICHVNADVIQATREAAISSGGVIEESVIRMDGKKKCLIITQPRAKGFNKTECVVLFEQYKIPIIGVSWLLNCAASYSRLPLSKTYAIYAKY